MAIKKDIQGSAGIPNLENLKKSYEIVRDEVGFSNVEIYNLWKNYCNKFEKIDLNTFKEYLKDLSSKGIVIFSSGDESLSNDKIKKAGVLLRGKLKLLIRFK